MRGGLMPEMAKAFNRQHHKTSAGRPIEVQVVQCDSFVQTQDLVSRVKGGGPAIKHCVTTDSPGLDPTIVTPQSDDELININQSAGRGVVDRTATRSIAETWLGIVTYREMAKCLGWPDKQLGYADIVELFQKGWKSHSACASAAWGPQPRLAFTNPSTSTSGRNVLISLYSMAARKAPADLTVDDIDRPDVKALVSNFNELVDHYMSTTLALMTKIGQGEKYGQFFLMPEDSLVNLNLGHEQAIAEDGTAQPMQGVQSRDLVMIYPKEGSVLNANPAAVVSASWVTPEESAAADVWINYLRSEDQQKTFAAAGFRPPRDTGFKVDAEKFKQWGLNPDPPAETIEPGTLQPAVLARILSRWGAVKNTAIVMFVVDRSGSMEDDNRLEQVKDGLTKMLDTISDESNAGSSDEVGLITFSNSAEVKVMPQPLSESKLQIGDFLEKMESGGGTALYDAIATGIEITDQAPGPEGAKRVVVVLTDGEANKGRCLSEIVSMTSPDERDVAFCGKVDSPPPDQEIEGGILTVNHQHEVQVFFVGFGDSDISAGRILAEATGAEYEASKDEELA